MLDYFIQRKCTGNFSVFLESRNIQDIEIAESLVDQKFHFSALNAPISRKRGVMSVNKDTAHFSHCLLIALECFYKISYRVNPKVVASIRGRKVIDRKITYLYLEMKT